MEKRIETTLSKECMRFLMWKLKLHPKRVEEIHRILVQFGWTQIDFDDIPFDAIEAAMEGDFQYLYSLSTQKQGFRP